MKNALLITALFSMNLMAQSLQYNSAGYNNAQDSIYIQQSAELIQNQALLDMQAQQQRQVLQVQSQLDLIQQRQEMADRENEANRRLAESVMESLK